jgi:hypothetical protein
VIEALREQGFEIHESVMITEAMICGVRSSVTSAWVKGGDELLDLAAGRFTMERSTRITVKEIAKRLQLGVQRVYFERERAGKCNSTAGPTT